MRNGESMKRSRTDGYGVTTALVSSLLLVAACWSDVPGPAGPRPPAPIDPHALLIWRDSATTGQLRPVFDDSSVYFHSLDPEYHRTSSVNKATGTLRWKVTIPVTNPQTAGLGLQLVSGVLVVGDRDMFGVSPATGALLWRYVPSIGKNPGFAHQTTDGTTVFCGSTTGHVYAVDGRTGTERLFTYFGGEQSLGIAGCRAADQSLH